MKRKAENSSASLLQDTVKVDLPNKRQRRTDDESQKSSTLQQPSSHQDQTSDVQANDQDRTVSRHKFPQKQASMAASTSPLLTTQPGSTMTASQSPPPQFTSYNFAMSPLYNNNNSGHITSSNRTLMPSALTRPTHGSPQYHPAVNSTHQRPLIPSALSEQPFRSDFQCHMRVERPQNLDSESQMRVYEELEKEASLRQGKLKAQIALLTKHTEQMKSDLKATEELALVNRGHLKDIEVFENDFKVRLRKKLLTEWQTNEIESLQIATLSELRSIVNSTQTGFTSASTLLRRSTAATTQAQPQIIEDRQSSSSTRQDQPKSSAKALSETEIDKLYLFTVTEADIAEIAKSQAQATLEPTTTEITQGDKPSSDPVEETKNSDQATKIDDMAKKAAPNSGSLFFLDEIFRSEDDLIREQLQKFPECAICMKVYVVGSTVKMLPSCQHIFHARCIDRWLRQKGSCPVDREDVNSNLQREIHLSDLHDHD